VQSNEGFPDKNDLLTATPTSSKASIASAAATTAIATRSSWTSSRQGEGKPEEAQAQYDMLKYECGADGSSVKKATLSVVRK